MKINKKNSKKKIWLTTLFSISTIILLTPLPSLKCTQLTTNSQINETNKIDINDIITKTNLGTFHDGKNVSPGTRELNSALKILNDSDGSKDANWHPNQWAFNNITTDGNGNGSCELVVVTWSPDYNSATLNLNWMQDSQTTPRSLQSTYDFPKDSDYSINNYWLNDATNASSSEILKTFKNDFGIDNIFNINQLTVEVISQNDDDKYGQLRIRPINGTNYYIPYNVNDSSTYILVNWSGIDQNQFIFADNWNDPTIKGKVIIGYQAIPQQTTTLIIPPYVEVIADEAFSNLADTNPSITKIVFSNNTRMEIRENAFANNQHITNVDAITANCNIDYLAANAFANTPWWNDVVQEKKSTETNLGYRYVTTDIFPNSYYPSMTWILGPSDDWTFNGNILDIDTTTFSIASHAFEKQTQLTGFSSSYTKLRYIDDYGMSEIGNHIIVGSGGYGSHDTYLAYIGNYGCYNTGISVLSGNFNGGTAGNAYYLYYVGNHGLDGDRYWGVTGGNGGNWQSPQWACRSIALVSNRQGYIGDSAFNNTGGWGNRIGSNFVPPYLNINAFNGWANSANGETTYNVWYLGTDSARKLAFFNTIENDPILKIMYQNAIVPTTVPTSMYDLIQRQLS